MLESSLFVGCFPFRDPLHILFTVPFDLCVWEQLLLVLKIVLRPTDQILTTRWFVDEPSKSQHDYTNLT